MMAGGLWWSAALAAAVLLLFTLPLLPALWELYRPTDDAPLLVVREHDSNTANFAHAFHRWVEAHYLASLQALESHAVRRMPLGRGESCILLGCAVPWVQVGLRGEATVVSQMLMAAGDLVLPARTRFVSEIYARGDVRGGAQSTFRAVLTLGHAVLEPYCVVRRWIHAHGVLRVAARSQLLGRASSQQCIELAPEVVFERLHAPCIRIGQRDRGAQHAEPPLATTESERQVFAPADGTSLRHGHWRLAQDLEIPPRSLCRPALVVHGNLLVGAGCRLCGAAKSRGRLVVGPQSRCDAALVAIDTVEIGRQAQIAGPIISEKGILLRRGSCVGSADAPTTISAPRIWIEPGCTVFGSIWAREHGRSMADVGGVVA